MWWVHGGANRICLAMSAATGGGGGWSSDTGGTNTARGSGYTQLDRSTRPYTTNKNSITNCFNGATNYGPVNANQGTYLGTVYASANGQVSFTYGSAASGGGAGLIGVWNMYNRVTTITAVTDSGTAYTYSGGTVRQARASAGNQVTYISGVAEDSVSATLAARSQTAAVSTAGMGYGIGFDTTSGYTCAQNVFANMTATATSTGGSSVCSTSTPPMGLHVVSSNENSDGTNANTFDQGTNNVLSVSIRN